MGACERGEQGGEAQVVAGCEPEPDPSDVDADDAVAGLDRVGLTRPEGVEQVDLVVVLGHRRAGDEQRVAHPTVGGGGEHAGDDGEVRCGGETSDLARPRAVKRLGDVDQPRAEPRHGRLGEHDEVGVRVHGISDAVGHQSQAVVGVGARGDLAQGGAHEGTVASRVSGGRCPPLADLLARYEKAGGTVMVCPICFDTKKLDAGTVPMWEWIGEDNATTHSY